VAADGGDHGIAKVEQFMKLMPRKTEEQACSIAAPERDLLARAKRERASLGVVWEQALDSLPARRQARLAQDLAKIKPVLIQGNGSRVPCEPTFRLAPTGRKDFAARMLDEGASRSEVLASVEISPSTLAKIARAKAPNGGQKWLSDAAKSVVSEEPARAAQGSSEPGPIDLDAWCLDPEAERRFRELMGPVFDPLPRMTAEEFERIRPKWHSWVSGSAKNPIHSTRRSKG
jgi:hypothetical protein